MNELAIRALNLASYLGGNVANGLLLLDLYAKIVDLFYKRVVLQNPPGLRTCHKLLCCTLACMARRSCGFNYVIIMLTLKWFTLLSWRHNHQCC